MHHSRPTPSVFRTGCLLLALAALFCTAATHARDGKTLGQATPWGFFRPAWETSGINAEMALITSDPQNRLEPELRVTPAMKKRVLFWALIYGRYDSRMRVVHDRRDPGIIYGVIDFSPLFTSRIPAMVREKRIRAMQGQILGELQRRLEASWHHRVLAVVSDREREEWRKFLFSVGVRNDAHLKGLFLSLRTQSGQKDMFEAALKRSSALLPQMEQIFARYRLPLGLSRIPFVESSFNTRARSRVAAMGIWQFMPRTARAFIHPRDRKRWVDPLVQTEAAARWLKRFRRAMPDWGTTITSYNSGTSRVSRLLRNSRGRSADDLVAYAQSTESLGFAGQNFYAEVVAANLVEAYKTRVFVPHLIREEKAIAPPLASFTRSKPTPFLAASVVPVYR